MLYRVRFYKTHGSYVPIGSVRIVRYNIVVKFRAAIFSRTADYNASEGGSKRFIEFFNTSILTDRYYKSFLVDQGNSYGIKQIPNHW